MYLLKNLEDSADSGYFRNEGLSLFQF